MYWRLQKQDEGALPILGSCFNYTSRETRRKLMRAVPPGLHLIGIENTIAFSSHVDGVQLRAMELLSDVLDDLMGIRFIKPDDAGYDATPFMEVFHTFGLARALYDYLSGFSLGASYALRTNKEEVDDAEDAFDTYMSNVKVYRGSANAEFKTGIDTESRPTMYIAHDLARKLLMNMKYATYFFDRLERLTYVIPNDADGASLEGFIRSSADDAMLRDQCYGAFPLFSGTLNTKLGVGWFAQCLAFLLLREYCGMIIESKGSARMFIELFERRYGGSHITFLEQALNCSWRISPFTVIAHLDKGDEDDSALLENFPPYSFAAACKMELKHVNVLHIRSFDMISICLFGVVRDLLFIARHRTQFLYNVLDPVSAFRQRASLQLLINDGSLENECVLYESFRNKYSPSPLDDIDPTDALLSIIRVLDKEHKYGVSRGLLSVPKDERSDFITSLFKQIVDAGANVSAVSENFETGEREYADVDLSNTDYAINSILEFMDRSVFNSFVSFDALHKVCVERSKSRNESLYRFLCAFVHDLNVVNAARPIFEGLDCGLDMNFVAPALELSGVNSVERLMLA